MRGNACSREIVGVVASFVVVIVLVVGGSVVSVEEIERCFMLTFYNN